MMRLLDSAAIIASGTAILYCVSTAHRYGFLRTLLLEPNTLDRNFHQVLYDGTVLSFLPILLIFLIYAVVLILYSYTILPKYIDFFRASISRKRRLIKFKNFFKNFLPGKNEKRKDTEIEIRARKRTLRTGFAFLAAFSFLIFLAYFEQRGVHIAKRHVEVIDKSRNVPGPSLISVTLDGEDKELYFLTCGAHNCAGIELGTKVVHYFPQGSYSYSYER